MEVESIDDLTCAKEMSKKQKAKRQNNYAYSLFTIKYCIFVFHLI